MRSMKLFQFAYSPYAAKVRKCLELKGMSAEVVDASEVVVRAFEKEWFGGSAPAREELVRGRAAAARAREILSSGSR